MKRFKNILVVYSNVIGSDDALLSATELARRNHAQLTLVEVVAPSDSASVEEHRRRLERIATSVQLEGLPVKAIVRAGTPFIEIIKLAMHIEADLVIAPAERTVGIRSLFIGNTSMRLIRKCPCPVWIVKPEQQGHHQRIVAAVDAGSPEATDLNIKILELASSCARRLGASLDVVYVWEMQGQDAVAVRSEMRPDDRQVLIAEHRHMYEQELARLVWGVDLDGVQYRLHAVRGEPADQLPRQVIAQQSELIVMGSVQRTGVGGLLVGSTAETLLRQVECAVLAVKPEGFVSPVIPDWEDREGARSSQDARSLEYV